jgi:hypothetical protein
MVTRASSRIDHDEGVYGIQRDLPIARFVAVD